KHHEALEKYEKEQKEYEKAKGEYEAAKRKRDEEAAKGKEAGKPPAPAPAPGEGKKEEPKKEEPKKEEKKPDLVEPKEPAKPGPNPALEAWRPVLLGKARLFCRAASAAEIQGALKVLKEEGKLDLVLVQGDESWKVAGALKKAGVGVLLGPRVTFPSEGRLVNAARVLAAEGVPFAFASDAGMGSRDLPLLAAWAVRHGLGPSAAVRALTLDAARLLGVEDRVGSLEPGKDADLVLLSGEPFRAGTRVRGVWIGGKEVPLAE
ncbi:MAG: amidohydrolase family protein, partial [Planctomycetes bacterium]|nr:amidohydrolase family protein [Planctomycetota bacterium]